VFAARTLLDALPLERRTAGGKTEIFTSELEKIVASGGGNGQVPVPELDILNLMVNRINEMRGVTEEQIVAGFQEFYIQERFYFADIVHIPWTASSLDSNLLRFDILSSTDRANALFKLTSDLLFLGKEVANPVNKDAEPNLDVVKIIDTFLALPRLILELIRKAVNDLSTDRSENDRNFSLQIVVALETALKNIGFYFDNVLSLETRTKAVESSARYNKMIETEKNVIEVLRMFKQERQQPQRVPRVDENVNNVVDDVLDGVNDQMQFGLPIRKNNFLTTGLLERGEIGPLSDLLKLFINNTSQPNVKLDAVKTDWKQRSESLEKSGAMIDGDTLSIISEVSWIISKYTDSNRVLRSKLSDMENDDDESKKKARELREEFSVRLATIDELVQNVYFREKLAEVFSRDESVVVKYERVKRLRNDFVSLPLRDELINAIGRVQTNYEKTIFIARQTKEFFKISNDNKIDQSEKATNMATLFDTISNAFRVITENKTVLDKLNVAVPVYEQARTLYDSASSVMKTVKSSLKPEDAQRVELLTKQRELERLADMKKQIDSFKGQLADSLKELQLTVAKAEKADSDASKLTAFLKDLQSLNSKIDEYNARIVAAQETLKNIDPEKMRAQIKKLKEDFPSYDEERNRVIAAVPNLLKDIISLKKDVDKTATDVEKVRKEAGQLSTSYEEARQDYDNVRETFDDFTQKVKTVNDAIDEQFVKLDNEEKAIKSRTDTIQLRAANLKRLQKISEETAADSEQIKAKIIQKDNDVSKIEVELARKVVEVRGTSKEYDSLLGRINFSYEQISDMISKKGTDQLSFAINDLILLVLKQQNIQSGGDSKQITLAKISELIQQAEKRILNSQISKIDEYLSQVLPKDIKDQVEANKKKRKNNDDDGPVQSVIVNPVDPNPSKERTVVSNDFESCLSILGLANE